MYLAPVHLIRSRPFAVGHVSLKAFIKRGQGGRRGLYYYFRGSFRKIPRGAKAHLKKFLGGGGGGRECLPK